MKSRKINSRVLIRAAAVIITIAAAFLFFGENGENGRAEIRITGPGESAEAEPSEEAGAAKAREPLICDISGEVAAPGVYELKAGSRLNDLILAAGGLTGDADISTVNRASPLSDGEKVHILSKEEAAAGKTASDSSGDSSGPVNINTAGMEELQRIPGVGPVTARYILDYRTEHGRFSSVEDLLMISGIGEKTLARMRASICL